MGGNKQLLVREASGMARAAYIRDYAHVRARNKYVRARALATIVFLQQNLRFIFLLHVCQICPFTDDPIFHYLDLFDPE